ncbi:hypothetical protein AWC38_SpisGene19906 [Stylophora pistillata]|uniref:Endonuclease/exonuclease/phosphatase domain-containing protein n=1 Tax=Stylophora pistillata TaxID=50429 RepID=A0A2B4RG86_STYPI|nr:hypothetical protein AWC38_SpisGene19906 [Stylophora pistillata]
MPKNFSTLEALAIQSKLGRHNAILLGLYLSLKANGKDYYLRLENELHDLISWASLQRELLIVTAHLNLDKFKPDSRECKILCDVEEVHGLTYLIDKPTRTTVKSQTLLDVILRNKPELFTNCDVYDHGICDHAVVYGVMTTRDKHIPTKVISFRSLKNLREKEFLSDLTSAPWHVGNIFDSLDDQYSYWNLLMNQVLDDHAPLRRMKVRARDVPYMNCNWKKAIKMKKRYAKKYTACPTEDNLKQMKKWRYETTKLWRKAMKEYWKRKAEDFRTKPREFYKAFKPFLDTRARGIDSKFINLEVNRIFERDQATVANPFANYFSSVAMDIGDPKLLTSTEEQLVDHPSVQAISQKRKISRDGQQFEFRTLGIAEVSEALGSLNLDGNFSKYQGVRFGPRFMDRDINIVITDTSVESYPILELLGVSIDGQMKFKEHIGEVTKKASKQVGVLLPVRNIIPQSAKLKSFKTAILPLLTYRHIVWHFFVASDARKLERVQEKALRAVSCSKTATHDTLLKMANLPTLRNRRLQDVAVLMYKVKHHQCPKYISNLFSLNSSGYALRNADFFT